MSRADPSWLTHWIRVPTPLGELVEAGRFENSRGTGFGAFRRLGCHALVLSLGGRARYRDASGVDTPLTPGDCVWVSPELPHQYGPEGGGRWAEIFLSFRGAPFADWFQKSRAPRPVQSLRDVASWLPRWLAIARTAPRDFREAAAVLAQIHLLLNDLTDCGPADRSLDERLEASRLRVEAWPASETPPWRQLARECGCGYEAWRKSFRRKFGVSPGRHRRDVLMRAASQMLARSSLTNAQVADHFGCSDAFHFSKLFKRAHGVSPREYRQRLGVAGGTSASGAAPPRKRRAGRKIDA